MIDWTKARELPSETIEQREAIKREREAAVRKIIVTTLGGLVFDGDEASQARMSRAYIALQTKPDGFTTKWVLADNTAVEVTKETLQEALALAGQAQTDIWELPL